MYSLPYTPTMTNQIITTNRSAPLATVSGRQVEHKPMAEFIALALAAATSESANTRRAYTRAWGDFLAYVSDVWGLDRPIAQEEKVTRPDGRMTKTQWAYAGNTRIFERITPSLRDGFMQAMVDQGLARSTRNQRKNAVNTMLAVAYRDGYITDDLARRLDVSPYKKRERRDEKPVGRRLSPQEVRKLRAIVDLKAKTDRKALRDRAILDLMLFAGLRRSEVAGLETDNLKQDAGRWWLVLTGKGSKTRRVKVHDALYKSLAAWAEDMSLPLGAGSDPLFCNLTKGGNPTGSDLNSSVIGRIVGEYGHQAGLAPATGSNRLSPHDLRRTCARNAFDNGASLPKVQSMLGHADVKTTMRYIGSQVDDDNTAVDFVRY